MNSVPEAIFFRGAPQKSSKVALPGAGRARSAEETYSRIAPLMPALGVTRVADITGVDRLGIPVVGVVRPLSAIQVYSWGKGATLLQAKISGMMEALERHCGENCDLSWIWESWEDLRGPKVPVDLLALKRENFFSPHRRERWVKGWDLLGQEEVYAPFRLVKLSFVRDFSEDTESFQGTSNGLSAGNTFLEALCSGLYECIERDAVTCWELLNQARGIPFPGRRVLREDVGDPLLQGMLVRCDQEEVEVLLLDCTVDTRVPTYACYLRDQRYPEYGIYHGRGTHLNPSIALLRAFTEAAQSRAVYFLGSHDGASLETHRGLAFTASVPLAERGALLEIAPPPEGAETATFEEDVALLLERIRSVGLPRVLVWDLTDPALGISVLRILVPGLEGWRMHHYAPGKRGQEFARKGAPW